MQETAEPKLTPSKKRAEDEKLRKKLVREQKRGAKQKEKEDANAQRQRNREAKTAARKLAKEELAKAARQKKLKTANKKLSAEGLKKQQAAEVRLKNKIAKDMQERLLRDRRIAASLVRKQKRGESKIAEMDAVQERKAELSEQTFDSRLEAQVADQKSVLVKQQHRTLAAKEKLARLSRTLREKAQLVAARTAAQSKAHRMRMTKVSDLLAEAEKRFEERAASHLADVQQKVEAMDAELESLEAKHKFAVESKRVELEESLEEELEELGMSMELSARKKRSAVGLRVQAKEKLAEATRLSADAADDRADLRVVAAKMSAQRAKNKLEKARQRLITAEIARTKVKRTNDMKVSRLGFDPSNRKSVRDFAAKQKLVNSTGGSNE